MRSISILILGVAAACAVATIAEAQTAAMPGRRAGLWEMSMSAAGMQGQSMKMRQCVNPATERGFSPFEGGPPGRGAPDAAHCSKRDVHRTAGGWAFGSVCTQDGKMVTSSGTITGDFQNHYKMDVVSSGGGGGPQHMSVDNRWVGPCPAGGGGNTIVLPDGRVMQIPSHHP